MGDRTIEIIETLKKAAKSGDPDATVKVIEQVEQKNVHEAIPQLIELLRDDPRIEVKNAAALALREFHADEAVPVLIKLLIDRKFDDQDGTFVYALQTMNWYREHALEVAILVTDKSFEVRLMALQALQEVANQLNFKERANFMAGLAFPMVAGRRLNKETRETMREALDLVADVPESAQLLMSV